MEQGRKARRQAGLLSPDSVSLACPSGLSSAATEQVPATSMESTSQLLLREIQRIVCVHRCVPVLL